MWNMSWFLAAKSLPLSTEDRVKSRSDYAHRGLAVKMTFHSVESVLQSSWIVLAVTIYVQG